jgi:poly-gamma-glutamate synthesis protein (capsule biosynthesis protein)
MRLIPCSTFAALLCCCAPGVEPPEEREAPRPVVERAQPPVAPEPPAPPEDTTFTVFAAGDVYLGSFIRSRVEEHGPEHPFARLKGTIEEHDVAFANLEAPISSRGSPFNDTKKPLFRISAEQARPLAHSGLDVMSVANNHMMDYRADALVDTLDALDSLGIARTGAGRTPQEADAPAVLEVRGTRVVILSYNRIVKPGMAVTSYGPGMSVYDLEDIVSDIEEHKKDGAVVLVSVHWGEQYVETLQKKQVVGAHAMIDAGADAVLGHHPHCPQPVEVYRGKPIYYSFGNFVFGLNPPKGRHNIAAVLRFDGDTLTGAEILPVHGMYFKTDYQPHFLEGDEARQVVEHIAKISERFDTQVEFSANRGIIAL